MKKKLLAFCLLAGLFLGFSQVSRAQHYYVSVEPVPPVIVRPAPPTPRHAWVEYEWVWRDGAYVHVPGYWAVPPRGHRRWVPGHWIHAGARGHYWIRGHWR